MQTIKLFLHYVEIINNTRLFSGFYLYAEASSPASTGNKARLLSKEFPATEGRCLSFWYHMYGVGMGSLNVILEDANGEHQIWKEFGNKGNKWHLGHVTVDSNITHKVESRDNQYVFNGSYCF